MPSDRLRRINEGIKEIVAARVLDLKDPRVGFVTITDVRTTPDLARADVYFTQLDDAAEADTAAGLESAAPLLRRELAAGLRIRRVPDLHFVHDPAPAHGRHIEELLREARERDDDR